MITKNRDNYALSCDICGEEAPQVFDDFYEAVEYKKDRNNGWRSRKDEAGAWEDMCPDCSKASGGEAT